MSLNSYYIRFLGTRLEFKNKLFTEKVYVSVLHLKLKLTSFFVLKFLESWNIWVIKKSIQNVLISFIFKSFYPVV